MPASVNVLTGSGMSFIIGRVSYTYGLQGTAFHTPPQSSIYFAFPKSAIFALCREVLLDGGLTKPTCL